jgi:hypothetical protein
VTARMTTLFCLLLALATSACGASSHERASAPPAGRPPTLYTVGTSLLGVPGHAQVRLAAAPVTPLAGWLAPASVPSPDGRYIAYNAWREVRKDDPALSWEDQGISPGDPLARPSIRIHDLETGADKPLVTGGFSLAWRSDGAVAYFKGADRDYRAGVPYIGQIVVREKARAPERQWTSTAPDRYVVVGWAGSTLLAYRERDGEVLDVLAFDRAGKPRVLAAGAGLVAISPDGSQALVERGPETGPPRVQLLSVANGRRLASLDLTTVDPAVGVVGYAGDWQDDLAVASSASGLAVFKIAGRSIELERAIRVAGGSVAEPRFAGAMRVTGWTSTSAGGAFIDCSRITGRCGRAVPLPAARGIQGFPTWRRPAYNPSRPQEGAL